MKTFIRGCFFGLVIAFGGCATSVNPTLVSDGQLFVAGLQTLNTAAAQTAQVPAADTKIAADALTAAQSALTQLQAGSQSASQFANVVSAVAGDLGPLLTDLKANASIMDGVAAVQAFAPVIAAEIGAVSATPVRAGAAPSDPRAALQAWVAAHK